MKKQKKIKMKFVSWNLSLDKIRSSLRMLVSKANFKIGPKLIGTEPLSFKTQDLNKLTCTKVRTFHGTWA